MSVKLVEFVARLGWDIDTKKVKEFNKSFDKVKSTATGITKAVSYVVGAFTGFAAVTGLQIARNYNLAKSVNMSVEAYEALGGIMGDIGLQEESVIDMAKELNKRIGMKKVLGVYPELDKALKSIGVTFSELKGLNTEQQFIRVADALKNLKDEQKAAALADKFFAEKGTQVVGLLRMYDESVAELVKKRQKLNLLDQESRKGTVAFKGALDDVSVTVRSLGALIFGTLAKSLEPLIRAFIDWAAANRQVIQSRIKVFAGELAKIIRSATKTIKWLAEALSTVVDKVGGLHNAIRLLKYAFTSLALVRVIDAFIKFKAAVKAATIWQTFLNAAIALWPALAAAAIFLIALLIEDLYYFFTGGKSVTGDFVNFVKGLYQEMVLVMEGWIADYAESFKAYYDEMVLVVENAITAVADFWGGLFNFLKTVVTVFIKFVIGTFQNMPEAFEIIGDTILSFFTGIIDRIKGLWDTLTKYFSKGIEVTVDKLKSVPVVGELFGDGDATPAPVLRPSLAAPSPADFMISPLVAASAGASKQTSIQNTTKIEAPVTIVQQPGQNGADLAREFSSTLEFEVGKAARNNSTGIEY